MSKRLYRVTCRGMQTSIGSSVSHGIAYVVAENPDAAYQMVRRYLDDEDLGFSHERELEKIELLAEEAKYPSCGKALFT